MAESFESHMAEAEHELLASIAAVKREPEREEFRNSVLAWAERLVLVADAMASVAS